MNNVEIRTEAKRRGVKMWMIAEELSIQDSALSRKLRHELPNAEKENNLEIINRLSCKGNVDV